MAEGGGDEEDFLPLPWREAGSQHSSTASSRTSVAHSVEDTPGGNLLERSDSPVCRDPHRPASLSVLPEPVDQLALDRGGIAYYASAENVATQDDRLDMPDEESASRACAESIPDETPRLASGPCAESVPDKESASGPCAESIPDEIPRLASGPCAESIPDETPRLASGPCAESVPDEESASRPCTESISSSVESVSSYSNSELESASANCSARASQQSVTPIAETESASSADAAIEELGQSTTADTGTLITRRNLTFVEKPHDIKLHAPRRTASDSMAETRRDLFQRQAALDRLSFPGNSDSGSLTIPAPEAVTPPEVTESPEVSAPAPPSCPQDEAVVQDQVQGEQQEAATDEVPAAAAKLVAETVLIVEISSATVGSAEEADPPQAPETGATAAAAAAVAAPVESIMQQLVAKHRERGISRGGDGQQQQPKRSSCPAEANALSAAAGAGQMQRPMIMFLAEGPHQQQQMTLGLGPPTGQQQQQQQQQQQFPKRLPHQHQPPISYPAQRQVEQQLAQSEPSTAPPSFPQVDEKGTAKAEAAAARSSSFFANSAQSISRQAESMRDRGGIDISLSGSRPGGRLQLVEGPPAEAAADGGGTSNGSRRRRISKFWNRHFGPCLCGHQSQREAE